MAGTHKTNQIIDLDGKSTSMSPKAVSLKCLINKLNYISFQNSQVLIRLRHSRYGQMICLPATPRPCRSDHLDCVWEDSHQPFTRYGDYTLECLLVPNGYKLLLVNPTLKTVNENGISLILPEACLEVSARKTRRHACSGIKAYFTQNSALYYGTLEDFSAAALRIQIKTVPPQTFEWINPELSTHLILFDGRETIYSGDCKILKQSGEGQTRSFVLKPLNEHIQRFSPKQFRSTRQKLTPSPDILFTHPFTQKTVTLKVIDLSGSGCSVAENRHEVVLLPGMFIKDLELNVANGLAIQASAQVIYRRMQTDEDGRTWIQCGIAFLQMDTGHHARLTALLQHAWNPCAYVCNRLDMDELWRFFFETGFIYPEKYDAFQRHREEIKKTYEKLYLKTPTIARYFTYQDNNRILGHMGMLRFYADTWLIHHHAAIKSAYNRGGIVVLNQIGRFVNDSHRLYSMHMDYLICYFRPDNKFPASVFGGVARNIGKPKGCSLDTFAYFHHRNDGQAPPPMPPSWTLAPVQPDDFTELKNFYEQCSGGLMLDALTLTPDHATGSEALEEEFRQNGFFKKRYLYALKKNNRLKAVVLVDITDIGLNLSDLTSSIKTLVIEPTDLSGSVLKTVFTLVAAKAGRSNMPVLLYPADFADSHGLVYEKKYTLWVLNMQFTDNYFKYLKRLLKFIKH